jgi:uncharacterized protein
MMDMIFEAIRGPWPWYVAGPLIGLTVPLLLFLGNKRFGLSSNLRHMCAVVPAARRASFFAYDWRREGGWNLLVFAGIAIGGFVGGVLLANPEPLAVAEPTSRALAAPVWPSTGPWPRPRCSRGRRCSRSPGSS